MERRDGYGEVYVHPSALTPDWSLKQGAPLQSPWAVNETSFANLFTGVLMNCRVFLKSWAEFLLSAAAWLQISLLCHHQRAMTVRAKVPTPATELHTTQCRVEPALDYIHLPRHAL